jgi:2'-5' RNA ligase
VAHTTAPLKITYRNFGHFGNKVLYIALTPSPQLFALQQELQPCLQQQKLVNTPKKPFSPHTTLATRDISPHQFETLWKEYREQVFAASFTAKELTLFQHDGERWEIAHKWCLVIGKR